MKKGPSLPDVYQKGWFSGATLTALVAKSASIIVFSMYPSPKSCILKSAPQRINTAVQILSLYSSPALQSAGKVFELNAIVFAVLLKVSRDIDRKRGMNEACRTDLDCRSACDHELSDILIRFDAAASDNRDIKHLCALSDQPVGVDVEVPRKITPSLVSYTMNDREQEQINASADPALRFLYFWTRKEALLKLTGEGIRNDMKQVLSESGKYHFETVKTNNYLFSVVKYREQFNDSPKP